MNKKIIGIQDIKINIPKEDFIQNIEESIDKDLEILILVILIILLIIFLIH